MRASQCAWGSCVRKYGPRRVGETEKGTHASCAAQAHAVVENRDLWHERDDATGYGPALALPFVIRLRAARGMLAQNVSQLEDIDSPIYTFVSLIMHIKYYCEVE